MPYYRKAERKPPKVYVTRIWPGRWVWQCYYCEPPVQGGTKSWEKTMRNVANHLRHRRIHHMWAARNSLKKRYDKGEF